MNWKLWLKGLGAACANAAIGAVAPMAVNWANQAATGAKPDPLSGSTIGMIALGSAILGASNYLIKSPRQTKPDIPTEVK